MKVQRLGWVAVLAIVLMLSPVATAASGDWLVRVRLLVIEPNDDADGTLGTLNTKVENDLTVEVDLSYFFTKHFAIEGILATAAQEVTIDPGMGKVSLGSVYHAPASFLAQYHFKPDGKTQPYVGAGVNYTIFYSESGDLETLNLDSGSLGLAAQVGLDRRIGEDKVFNVDLKYIMIETDVDDMGTPLGTVEVNPLVIGFGFGFRF
jgi:outer membrane protein